MSNPQKVAIVTDSSCDLSDKQLSEHNIKLISLRVVCQNKEYRDRVDISQEQLYEMMRTTLPKTSLPLPEDVTDMYDKLVEEEYTDVIHVSISSGLSGTFNMVRMVAQDYEDVINIHLIDSTTLSAGLGNIVLSVAQTIQNGGTVEEALIKAKNIRKNQLGAFVIRTLEFLRKGGRIGLVEGVVGNLLHIKPVIFLNEDGVYQTLCKARGYKNAIDSMTQEIVKKFGVEKVDVSVVHGQAFEEAQKLMESLKTKLNINNCYISPVSPVLAVHTGPGLLGIIANLAE